MKVSLNTVKQFTNIDISVDELKEKINSQLGTIDKVINLGARYEGALIVKVIEAEQHPNADRLSVTKVDDGGVAKDVPRDESGYIQVVCGAPNARAGMFAVWLPPQSTVPASFDEKEPFVLDARELRGVLSQGMLAAADELAIGSDHTGIIEIDPEEQIPSGVEIEPGVSFAKAYGLDDVVIDIENKMFTHRPDLFGQLGVAREIAGIQQKQFTSPDWYLQQPEFASATGLELEVFNDAGDNAPRFVTVALKNVTVKPSPLWLQCELVRLGSKSINNIVDITNYIMLLTAQPVHAYDYDKIRGCKLGVRMAESGEKVTLLNGKTYELDESDIVIADGEGPVGLAGIMGGGESEVDDATKNIVLEVANFDMYTLRKTSMRHGVFTDALTRFNKGQSPHQNAVVLSFLMKSMFDAASGEQASDVTDLYLAQSLSQIDVSSEFISARLGVKLDASEIAQLLTNTELAVEVSDQQLAVTPPFWRTDLAIAEDIVEEVGRLYGYSKLPRILPYRSTKPTAQNPLREQKKHVRSRLSCAGANEVLTYSFVHENTMKQAGQDASYAFRLSNALSPELQYYRLSLTPSLIDKVHMNIKAGYDRFVLFEQNKVHFKGEMDASESTVPNEDNHVALVLAYDDKVAPKGSAYYHARKYLSQIVALESVVIAPLAEFDIAQDLRSVQFVAPYEPKRSAVIMHNGQVRGVVGEFKSAVKKAFKLPKYSAGFELHSDIVPSEQHNYRPLSKYPRVMRDVCFKVDESVTYAAVVDAAAEHDSGDVRIDIAPLDVYQAPEVSTKNITLSITLSPETRTLSSDEANRIITLLCARVTQATSAEVI